MADDILESAYNAEDSGDFASATNFYKQASDLGSYVGAYNYALGCYRQGDLETFVTYLNKAIELGFFPALYNLAVAYADGVGIAKNVQMAKQKYIEYLARVTDDRNIASAQNNLGVIYLDEGQKDKARELFLQSAKNGCRLAYKHLGLNPHGPINIIKVTL